MKKNKDSNFIVYKKVRVLSNGKCYPLFIDKQKPFEFGQWMHCEYHPTKGFKERSLNGFNNNPIGAWHACFNPIAPHLADELKSGEQRVWIECMTKGKMEIYERPTKQGGSWLLVEWIKPLRIVPEEEVNWMNENIGCNRV